MIRFADGGRCEDDSEWCKFWEGMLSEHDGIGSVRVQTFSPFLSMKQSVNESEDMIDEVQQFSGRSFWGPLPRIRSFWEPARFRGWW